MSFAQKSEKKWTEEEDEVLRAAVAEYEGAKINWQKISDCLPGRSNKSCRKRWIHSLDPTLRKGRWTSAEDAVLLDAVAMHGQNWSKVARHVDGRTDDQCAKRWRENLDPSISREPWTPEEDRTLLEALRAHGQKWNTISTLLPGRASVHCRNRYSRLRRARDTTSSQQEGSRASSPSGRSSPADPSSSYSTPIDSRSKRLPDELLRLNVDTSASASRSAGVGSGPSVASSGVTSMSPLSASVYDVPSSSALSPTTPTSPHHAGPATHPTLQSRYPVVTNQPELSHRLIEAFFNDNAQVRNREGRWYPQPGDDIFLFSTSQEEEFMRNMQQGQPYRGTTMNNIAFSSANVPNPGNRGFDAGRSYMPNIPPSYQGSYVDDGMGSLLGGAEGAGPEYVPQQMGYPTSSQTGQYDRTRYHQPSQGHASSAWPVHEGYAQPSRLPFQMPVLDSSNEALNLATLSTWLSMTLPPDDTTPEVSGSTSPGSSEAFESSPSPTDDDGYSTVHDR